MLRFGKPLTGAIYPRREMDLEEFHRARTRIPNPDHAKATANAYVSPEGLISADGGGKRFAVVDGFVRARHVGTGIMLVERSVLEAMMARFPELWVQAPPPPIRRVGLVKGGLLQCFEPIVGPDGMAQGEDISFCQRWTDTIGGELWANIDEPILTWAAQTHTGHFLTRLRNMGAQLDITETAKPPAA